MKKILFILLFINNFSFSQNTINEVIYKKKLKINLSKIKTDNDSDKMAIIENLRKGMDKREYQLLFNNNISLFKPVIVLKKGTEASNSFRLADFMGGVSGKYYIDVSKDSVVNQKNFRTDLFRITSKLSDKNWKIDFETSKKIGKYTCHKAIGTKTQLSPSGKLVKTPVTAWFCTALPFSFGPAEYAGLPGLILELEIRKTVIYADKITLNKKLTKKEQGIKPLKKGILLSSEDYIKMQKSGGVYKRPKR